MLLSDRLVLAEDIAYKFGNYAIFQQLYINARQSYDIETSIEMALSQQNLLSKYLEETNK